MQIYLRLLLTVSKYLSFTIRNALGKGASLR